MSFSIDGEKVSVKIDFDEILMNINRSAETPAQNHLLATSKNDQLLNPASESNSQRKISLHGSQTPIP